MVKQLEAVTEKSSKTQSNEVNFQYIFHLIVVSEWLIRRCKAIKINNLPALT